MYYAGSVFIAIFAVIMTEPCQIPNILASVTRRGPIAESSIRKLCALITERRFPKRHMLISEGLMCGTAYFIEQGMTRSFWVVDGEEITTSFSTEGGMSFSMDEVYYRKPSEEYVESVEPLIAYSISVDDLLMLVSSDLDLARWWAAIHQDEYRRLHRSHKERLTLVASERYKAFASQFPDVARRARLTDIASYLGITPSTLSRIRSGAIS